MKVRSRAEGKKSLERIIVECPVCHDTVKANEIEASLSLSCAECAEGTGEDAGGKAKEVE